MSMSMKSVFRVEEGVVHFERMTLLTDGAESHITGDADIKNWPEMTYQVKSTVDFKRMRELFFAKDNYTLSGEGRFNGVFHLFKGGRALTGDFESDAGGPADRRPRLRVPRSEGQARLVSEPLRGDGYDHRFLRRRSEPEIFHPVVGKARRSRRTRGSTPSGATSIWPATAISFSMRGRAPGRPMERAQPARVADGPFPRAIGRRLLGSHSARGRRSARRHAGERLRERTRSRRRASADRPSADRRTR